MAYPTEPPVYPECGSNDLRSRAAPDYPTAVASAQAASMNASSATVRRPLVAALDDLHGQLDALRDEAQALLKRLEPVLGPATPTGVDGGPNPDTSKFANAISIGTRKAAAIRLVLSEINDRLEF